MASDGVPVVDIGCFLDPNGNPAEVEKACAAVAEALHLYGCLVVRDSRCAASKNEEFLDMMERYFEQADGSSDARPELSYQVGVTPSDVEKAREHCTLAKQLSEQGHGPISDCPPRPDAKWRFFWRIGARPTETAFQELNAPAVVPDAFQEEWAPKMDGWGESVISTAHTVAEMAALGFGVERDAFSKNMTCGPHLLAPTGSDLGKLADLEVAEDAALTKVPRQPGDDVVLGTVLAGFHYDLNFLTVHGKSRFPGLTVWRRDGVAVQPKIPEGCLFVQAGIQLEHLTGGHVKAGFHEVIATKATAAAAKKAKADGKRTWRVSSTCFAHVASDFVLEPLPGSRFDTPEARAKFPPVKAGDSVMNELRAIGLAV
ncbi:hypothetical protein M885DRAFT_519408 [Pelagophyceae sp. CCMP2097]|nr:hypothetical protein M885DRAFT_519408 [Pelagophyceae sp. CCMP2097]